MGGVGAVTGKPPGGGSGGSIGAVVGGAATLPPGPEYTPIEWDEDAIAQYRALGGANADRLRNARSAVIDGKTKYFDAAGAEFVFDEPIWGKVRGTQANRKDYITKSSERPGRRATILGEDANTQVMPYSSGTLKSGVLG